MTSGSGKGRWSGIGVPTGPPNAAVIDASVGLKWVLPEPGSAAAEALRSDLVHEGAGIYVPDLFWSETGNALWRLARGDGAPLAGAEARELFDVLRLAPLRTEPIGATSARALEIALATDLTTYDAAYVALAERLGASFWTADAVLARKLAGTEWANRVTLLE